MRRCDHRAADLLFFHVQERLGAEERRLVEEHLASCDVCRRRVELIAWVRQTSEEWGASLFEEHVPTEMLLAFCEAPEKLTPEQMSSVRTHLKICRSCSSEVEPLRQVEATLVGAGTERVPGPTKKASLWDALFRLLRPVRGLSPVPAYLVALVLLLPAISGVRHWLGRKPDVGAPEAVAVKTVLSPIFVRSGTQRGEEDLPVATVGESGEMSLILQAPIAEGGDFRYDVELLGPSGACLWRAEDVQSVDRFGTFVLLLQASKLPAGRYLILLHEKDAERRESLQTFRFPFRIDPTSESE
jgi:anti-sigma factor RsiW